MNTAEVAIIFITGTLTLLVFVFFVILIIIEYRKRQVRHITEKLELKHQYHSQVLQTKVEVQEQSFRHFSDEVHDNIAQMLALARLKLYKVAEKTSDNDVKNGIVTGAELVGKTLDGLRNLSHVMNGTLVARIPLADSLEKEIRSINSTGDVVVTVDLTGKSYELPGEKKLLLFRTVQEAIGNAIKHGRARQINIILAYEPKLLTVSITDNGKGFDTRLLKESNGLGLHNMQVRAKMLGEINVVSEIGKGTSITLKVKTDG